MFIIPQYLAIVKRKKHLEIIVNTVIPVLSGHSKIDKTKVLKTDGSLMHVQSIAECSLGAFCNTFERVYHKNKILSTPC